MLLLVAWLCFERSCRFSRKLGALDKQYKDHVGNTIKENVLLTVTLYSSVSTMLVLQSKVWFNLVDGRQLFLSVCSCYLLLLYTYYKILKQLI